MYTFVVLSALVAVCVGSALPLDTPEVAHAKAAHLAAVEQAKARNYGAIAWSAPAPAAYSAPAAHWAPAIWSAPASAWNAWHGAPAPVVVAHGQVQDTPEVAAEKSKHFALVAEAAARAASSPDLSGHSDDGQYHHDPSGDADWSPAPAPAVAWAGPAVIPAAHWAAPAAHWAAPAAYWAAAPAPIVVANGQVQDTPEVAAAKAAHLAKLHAAGGAHW